jgi:hypothetical protein
MMIVRGTTTVTINAYEIILDIGGQESTITLDDTFPAIDDWASACSMAVLMAKHIHPEKEVELVSVAEYEAEEYNDYGYIYEAPMAVQ